MISSLENTSITRLEIWTWYLMLMQLWFVAVGPNEIFRHAVWNGYLCGSNFMMSHNSWNPLALTMEKSFSLPRPIKSNCNALAKVLVRLIVSFPSQAICRPWEVKFGSFLSGPATVWTQQYPNGCKGYWIYLYSGIALCFLSTQFPQLRQTQVSGRGVLFARAIEWIA